MCCGVELGVAMDAASGLVPLPAQYQRIVAGFLFSDDRSNDRPNDSLDSDDENISDLDELDD